jgi:hypothetical protein
MAFIVERYLPGLSHAELLRSLERLTQVTEELGREGELVRYLGSTIVPEDEACFCHFEAHSEVAVARANERAGVPFHRIITSVEVGPRLPRPGESESAA